jgi:hypothetical protein
VHVVPDAPRGSGGRSDVTATHDGDNCTVTVTAHDGDGGYDGKPLVLLLDPDCAITEDPTQDGFQLPPPENRPDGGLVGDDDDDDDSLEGGCCQTGSSGAPFGAGLLVAATAIVLRLRRRR